MKLIKCIKKNWGGDFLVTFGAIGAFCSITQFALPKLEIQLIEQNWSVNNPIFSIVIIILLSFIITNLIVFINRKYFSGKQHEFDLDDLMSEQKKVDVRQIWVYANKPLEASTSNKEAIEATIRENIAAEKKYVYFVGPQNAIHLVNFIHSIEKKLTNNKQINVEFIILPEIFLLSSYTLHFDTNNPINSKSLPKVFASIYNGKFIADGDDTYHKLDSNIATIEFQEIEKIYNKSNRIKYTKKLTEDQLLVSVPHCKVNNINLDQHENVSCLIWKAIADKD